MPRSIAAISRGTGYPNVVAASYGSPVEINLGALRDSPAQAAWEQNDDETRDKAAEMYQKMLNNDRDFAQVVLWKHQILRHERKEQRDKADAATARSLNELTKALREVKAEVHEIKGKLADMSSRMSAPAVTSAPAATSTSAKQTDDAAKLAYNTAKTDLGNVTTTLSAVTVEARALIVAFEGALRLTKETNGELRSAKHSLDAATKASGERTNATVASLKDSLEATKTSSKETTDAAVSSVKDSLEATKTSSKETLESATKHGRDMLEAATKANKATFETATDANKDTLETATKANKELLDSATKANKETVETSTNAHKQTLETSTKANEATLEAAMKSNKETLETSTKANEATLETAKTTLNDTLVAVKTTFDETLDAVKTTFDETLGAATNSNRETVDANEDQPQTADTAVELVVDDASEEQSQAAGTPPDELTPMAQNGAGSRKRQRCSASLLTCLSDIKNTKAKNTKYTPPARGMARELVFEVCDEQDAVLQLLRGIHAVVAAVSGPDGIHVLPVSAGASAAFYDKVKEHDVRQGELRPVFSMQFRLPPGYARPEASLQVSGKDYHEFKGVGVYAAMSRMTTYVTSYDRHIGVEYVYL